jgi:hypothetical protein
MENLVSRIDENQARLEKLVSAYLDGDIPREIYLKQKDKAMRACAALEQRKQDFNGGRNQWVEPLQEWIKDTKQADFLVSSPDYSKMKQLLQKIGTNPQVRDKSARLNFSAPSRFVAKRRPQLVSSAIRNVGGSSKLKNHTSQELSAREVTSCGTFWLKF